MGCTRNDKGEQIIGGRARSPELRAFLEEAIDRFQPQSQAAFFEEDIRSIVEGLVGMCGLDSTLDKKTLEQIGEYFVRLCGFTPEGTRTSPEGDRTPVIEGSCHLVEAR